MTQQSKLEALCTPLRAPLQVMMVRALYHRGLHCCLSDIAKGVVMRMPLWLLGKAPVHVKQSWQWHRERCHLEYYHFMVPEQVVMSQVRHLRQ